MNEIGTLRSGPPCVLCSITNLNSFSTSWEHWRDPLCVYLFTNDIPAGLIGEQTILIPLSDLPSPPIGATTLMAVVDPDNRVAESNEQNNLVYLSLVLELLD